MMYFYVAVGMLFCSFWVAQLIFVRMHLWWSMWPIKSGRDDVNYPVSVIHPIKDLDFELEKNLESWMKQYYKGPVQHIFSFQDPEDPAIEYVERLKERYPEADIEIIVNPVMPGLNGKSSNMVHGMKRAKYDIVLFGDSDIRVRPDFIVKMVRPLKDEKVGVTTCGQINIGGSDFWTRFFTFVQNSETDFMWAFFTKLGIDVGITGAAFAMRKKLLLDIGGLEAFGDSLLEDLHLGNTLYRMGYKIVLGPFVECHVQKIEREKSFNYAKRIATGIRAHIAVELPAFIVMLFWYWAMFIWAAVTWNKPLLYLSFIFMGIRTIHGILQRLVTMNKIKISDFYIPLFFDLFGTFYLMCAFRRPEVVWRGIRYEVRKGGYIEAMDLLEDDLLEEQVQED
jgi:cellulose synthase/poly-beta-1,6-N-acetylglucosamine synthase-like glycosyltransferase